MNPLEPEVEKLQGTWKVKKVKGPGAAQMPAAAIDLMEVSITQNRLVLKAPGLGDIMTTTFKVDASKNPKTMVLTLTKLPDLSNLPPEVKAKILKDGATDNSIYELNGDRLIIRSSGGGNKPFPKELKEPEAGSTDSYLELERKK